MNQVIDIHQLVQDVNEGKENPMKAFMLLSEQLKDIKNCIQEVAPCARQAHRSKCAKVVISDGYAFTITKNDGIKYQTNAQHFYSKSFVEWDNGNIVCYQVNGNYKQWKQGIKRKGGKVLFDNEPKSLNHIEKLINNGGY